MKNNLCSLSHVKKTLLGAYILLAGLSAKAQTVSTYSYTGAVQSFTAPSPGIVTINCKGAKGANGIPGYAASSLAGTGALGGTVEGTYPVAGGQVLYVWVGGAASGSTGGVNGGGNGDHSSGGGGGASDIRLGDVALGSRILVAGGGGGGGNGGSSAANLFGGNGGVGGGGAGTNGTNSTGGFGGIGAIGATGGAAGGGCFAALGTPGGNGVDGQGGAGGVGIALLSPSNIYSSGGGGGGGHVGGGGGGAGSAGTYSCTLNETGAGAGGAGGSNYIASGFTSTTSTTGTGPSGNGSVVITFTAVDPITGTLEVCAGSTRSLSNATTGGTWSSGDVAKATINSSGVVSGIAAGTATISYLTPAGATATAVVTVNPLAVSTGTYTAVSCNGGSNGRASVTYSGGTSPYTFSWAPSGGTASLATGLAANSYTCTITDGKACVTTQTVTVTQPSAISTVGSYTNVACNGGSTGRASVSVSGGTPSYFYSWAPSGGTGSTASGLSAGNYTVTVTDNNSCTRTQTVTVTQPTSVGTATAVTNVACNGGNTGVASITGIGGTSPYTYSWSTGSSLQTITGRPAGVYTATVTDANGCTATKNATITQPSAISGTTIVTNATCGNNDGAIDLTVSGGVGGYTYLWNGGATTQDRTGLAAGTHTVVITDANSCTFTLTPTVGGTVITGTTVVTDVSCNGGNNGSIDLTPTGGTAPYTYSWSGGAITEDPTGLAAGTYTVSITDAGSSCTGTVTATVGQPATALSSTGSYTATSCNGGSNGRASVSVSGGTPGYSYSWAPSGGTAALATGLAAGDYTVTVTDNNACVATQTVTVTQPSAISAVGSYTATSCNGGSNGIASVSAGGGTPSYSYSWAPSGGTGVTATGLAAGIYTVTITDFNTCTKTQTVTVTQPSAVTTSTAVTTVSCYGGNNGVASVTASGGVGGYSYLWSTGSALQTITGLPAGVYTVTVTDANSCIRTRTATITQPATAVSIGTVSSNGPVCPGATLSLSGATASGGVGSFSYSWEGPDFFSSTALNPSLTSVTTAAAGIYTFAATDANNCQATGTVSVAINPSPDAGAITGTASVCAGSTTTLGNGTGGGLWTSGDAGIATVTDNSFFGVTLATVNGITAGTATISYSVTNSCGTDVATQIVTVNPLPDAGTITGTASVCEASTTTLSNAAVGGTWSSDAATVASIDVDGVVSGNSAGTATITYTATTVCGTATATQVVTVNPLPNAGTITGTATVCEASTTTLSNVSVGGTWSTDAPGVASIDIDGVVSGVAAGIATITYTSTTVCGTATTTQVVTVNPLPDAGTITGTATVCEASTTTLSNSSVGGTWSSDATSVASVDLDGVVSGVAAGTATITYTSTTVCGTATATQVVTVNPLPNAGTITGTASVCETSTTTLGNATAIGTGAWSIDATGAASIDAGGVISGLVAGTATVTYTATTVCGTATTTQIVTVNPLPDAGTITGTASVCEASTTTLANASAGGTWVSDATGIATVDAMGVVSGVAAGTATITYTVINGCGTATTTQIATVNPLPVAGSITGAAHVCMTIPSTLTTTVSGGVWSTDAAGIATVSSTGVVSGVSGGTATLSYSVTNGCGTAIATHMITVVPLPTAGAIAGTASVCPGSTTTLSNAVTGGVWSDGSSSIATINSGGIVSGIAAGTTTITYMVSNVCGSAMATTIVTVNALPDAGTITGATSVCQNTTITLSDAVSGGAWTMSVAGIAHVTGSGVVLGVTAGTVTITYTVSNVCGIDYTTKVVTVNPLPIVGTISGTASLNVGSTTTLSNTITGGTWSTGAATVATVNASGVVTGVSAGTAVISYTITNGCSASATTIVTVYPVSTGLATTTAVNISLYPNPTSGTFAVTTPEAGNLSIYTLEGREVMNTIVNAGTTNISLSSTMATGIYMCRFTGNNGTQTIARMVYER